VLHSAIGKSIVLIAATLVTLPRAPMPNRRPRLQRVLHPRRSPLPLTGNLQPSNSAEASIRAGVTAKLVDYYIGKKIFS